MEITFDAWRWMSDTDGQWICLRTDSARGVCEGLEPGKTYGADIKVQRKKRSLDANAYCWVLLDRLAAKVGEPKTEIYRRYIKEIGGNSETVCVLKKAADKLIEGWGKNGIGWLADKTPSKLDNCVNVVLYYGSSTYDSHQMSRLIDMAVQDCKSQGIETLTPCELDRLVERWGA